MSGDSLLVGPLAHPGMLSALGLTGSDMTITGTLIGGAYAGIAAEDWPCLQTGTGRIRAVRVTPNQALLRYVAVMGLAPVNHPDGRLLGARSGNDSMDRDTSAFDIDLWPADLAIEIMQLILETPEDRAPETISRRLPMIGVWAASRLRGRASSPSGGNIVPLRSAEDVRILSRRQPFAGYFANEIWDLSHRRHDGSFTPVMTREGFISGDAVVVLPWDPVRDRVLAIEQFRLSPALRDDPQPWLLEPIAGRVDAGETVEEAARREALEEADLRIGALFPAVHHYPSPGALGEYLYLYVGIVDLPDGVAGIHGLEGEVEDIRGHLLGRQELMRMVLDGQISNGPMAMIALWLHAEKDRLLAELSLG